MWILKDPLTLLKVEIIRFIIPVTHCKGSHCTDRVIPRVILFLLSSINWDERNLLVVNDEPYWEALV